MDGRTKNGGARKGSGRKPDKLRQELPKVMDEACPKEARVRIFRTLAARAQSGDTRAAALILSYLYGKPIERQEITGEDGDGIKVVIQYADNPIDAT